MSASNNFDPAAIAIEICNKDAFKIEVLSGIYSDQETPENCKKSWDEKVETIAGSLLEDYPDLQKNEQEAVIGVVFSIALRMLTWIEFHIGTFGFTRDFCIEFLDSPLFTREGIIDYQRVETKMSEKPLSNLQRFQLACFYCQWREIPGLFNNLSTEEKNLVYNETEPELIRQPDIIKFWSYHTMGELDTFKGNSKFDQFRLKIAIMSGSQLAVNYCVERTKSKQSCLTDTAVSIFRHRIHREIRSDEHLNIVDDWIVFGNKKYCCTEESWVPDTFFVDIFYSLISAMSKTQQRDFWRQIFDTRFILSNRRITPFVYVKVLDWFLCYPYQDLFLEFLKSSWSRLSLSVFSLLLLNILNRIEPERGHFWYGEEKFYDYRKLFMDVWTESPECIKMRLFKKYANIVLELFKSIYNLKTFNERDGKNIKSIIESATKKEGFNYMMSDNGFKIASMLLENKRLDSFNELISTCFISPEEVRDYKAKVILLKAMKDCLEFIKNEKWHEAEEILRWSEYKLTDEEMLALKSILISCKDGVETCIALWKADPNVADQFVRWCLPPEEVLSYKHKLILGEIGQKECRELCISNTVRADDFVHWCVPLEMHNRFKAFLINQVGSICMCTKYVLIDNTPELADKLIGWCLPEEHIKEFKKFLGHNKIEVFPAYKTTFRDIENCTDDEFPDKIFKWNPAKKMFSWCFALSPKEKIIVSNAEGEKIFALNAEGEKILASDAEGVKSLAPDSEGVKSLAPDAEGVKSLAPDAEGVKSLASDAEEELILASDAEEELILASDVEGEKSFASDTEGGKITAPDAEGGKTIASDAQGGKTTASDAQTTVSDSEGEVMQAFDPAGEETEASDPAGEETEASDPAGEETEASDPAGEETEASDPAGEETEASDSEEEDLAIDPEEKKKFKRMFLRKSQREIIYKCIESNNWNVADRFLSWLNLDKIGLRKVKTEQICSDTETGELLSDLLSREENDPKFAETEGKQQTIERFIHWFLVDDVSIVRVFIKRLLRYSDDSVVQNIIIKLKQSDDIETIKGLLMTY